MCFIEVSYVWGFSEESNAIQTVITMFQVSSRVRDISCVRCCCFIDSCSFQESIEWDSDKESLPDDRDGPQGRDVSQIV